MNTINPKHKHFDANTAGCDFVVSDLHGCFDELMQALNLIQFDFTNDRLFSVGDLIDRGPNSLKTVELMYERWFHCVRGNHEQFMIDALIHDDRGMARSWFENGGDWRYQHDPQEMQMTAQNLMNLPLVISVGEGADRFNIVHAELTHRVEREYHMERVLVTDQTIDNWEFDEHDETDMLWGRGMVMLAKSLNANKDIRFHDVTLSPTFVGHTQMQQNVMIERQIYLDTSAVNHHIDTNKSELNCITIASPSKRLLHKFSMVHHTIQTVEFDSMLAFCQ
jgi:serine/threonine protein phosphatase 1